MIFSALVTIFLLGLIVYALLQKREYPFVGRLMPFVATAGIYVVWFPERTTRAADWVGIGRGVDLMVYLWILVSALLILVLHLKLITYERRFTELARALALQSARAPNSPAEGAQHASASPPSA